MNHKEGLILGRVTPISSTSVKSWPTKEEMAEHIRISDIEIAKREKEAEKYEVLWKGFIEDLERWNEGRTSDRPLFKDERDLKLFMEIMKRREEQY